MATNVICLWYDGTAEDAARFYAQTFPDSAVTGVHHAPGGQSAAAFWSCLPRVSSDYRRVEEWARRPGQRISAQEVPLFDALKHLAADSYDQVVALGHIMRPAYLYSREHPERVGADWSRLGDIARRGFRVFLRGRASQLGVDDVDRAADVLCYLFNLLLLGPLLHAEDRLSGPLRDRKEFSEMLATEACGYLTSPSGVGR